MSKKTFRLGDRVQLKAHGKDFRGTVVALDKNDSSKVKIYWNASPYSFEEVRVENKNDLVKLRWVYKSSTNDSQDTNDPMQNYISKVEHSNDLGYVTTELENELDYDSDSDWDPIFNDRQDDDMNCNCNHCMSE